MVCGGAISATLRSLLCLCRFRLLPFNIAQVVRRLVTLTAIALILFPRVRASTSAAGAPTRDAPVHVSAITLGVSKTLAAFLLQWAFGATYDFTETPEPLILEIDRNVNTSDPRATDTIYLVWGGNPSCGPLCDCQMEAS